eukprot:461882_1
MPSWRSVASLTVISVGTTALYFTCPSQDTFDEFFEKWYNEKLWPIISKQINGNCSDNNQSTKPQQNKLLKWLKSTANKATNVIEKGVLFTTLFPNQAQIESYYLCRVAKITMYIDQYPQGMELIFIGAGNGWFLNPLQNALLNFQ